jgi:hypothetical protein
MAIILPDNENNAMHMRSRPAANFTLVESIKICQTFFFFFFWKLPSNCWAGIRLKIFSRKPNNKTLRTYTPSYHHFDGPFRPD